MKNTEDSDLAAKRRQFLSQPSTVATRRQQAVCVRRAHKTYGTQSNPNIVLDGLNMTVPKGSIYGLLGASGCGKTTLLSCIVGRRRLNSGEIWVLGGRPGSKGSGVPGPRIGYMPQELALYGEFTIRETLIYFGWIAGMNTSEVDEKTEFFIKLLQLPNSSRFIKSLSGGQQRRMSLAAALIHEPELLILDEPTVGVDPVLRNSIWNYLVEITNTGNRTVIITTHYIEETRQAHMIGLMRGGKFLAEESPDFLLQQYNSDSLEDVFLKLSVLQNMGKRRRSSIAQDVAVSVPAAIVNPALDLGDEEFCEISGEFGDNISMSSRAIDVIMPTEVSSLPLPPEEQITTSYTDFFSVLQKHHMKALIWKNFLWMWRNVGVMLFIIGLPCLQIILFCWAIGHDVRGLKIAVSNHELNYSSIEGSNDCPVYHGCNYTMLSCRYLEYLSNKSIVYKIFPTDEAAFYEVKRGNAWAAVVFARNFSETLIMRTDTCFFMDEWNIDASNIDIRMDMSNQQIGLLLYRDIQNAYFDFVADILSDCGVNPSVGKLPISWEQAIYGVNIPNFTDFAAPGVILTIVFFIAVALTAGSMIIERKEGMLERSMVGGITGSQILCAALISLFAEQYATDEDAYSQVRQGKAWGALVFAQNYSEALIQRTENGKLTEEWDIESSTLGVRLDMSNQQISTLLYRDIQYAFFDFLENILSDCGENPKIGQIPLQWEDPIYGVKIPNFTDFAAPGVILTIIFFLSVALTSGAMLIERNEGMLERCLVCGITGIEILFAHVITQFLIMCFQAFLVLLFSFYVFELTINGDMMLVISLTILTGLCGMCFGFVVSSACDNERTATYMAMGSFLPIVMLCGIIWPIEGMYPILRYIASFLPLTKSTECLRAITQRGWTISNPEVYSGFISTGIWVLVFLTISILLLKFKKG